MGIHSIIVIKNEKNQYLQYFDKSWNSYLFPNCKLTNGQDFDIIKNKVSKDLNMDKKFIKVSLVGCKKHKKFSESAKIEKEYVHYFYNTKINGKLSCDEFEIKGIKYKWFSYSDLIKDERIQEVNSDIVQFVKELIGWNNIDIKASNKEEMYFDVALKVKNILDKSLKINKYEHSIWNENGRHDVEVNYKDVLYKYKYYDKNNEFWLEKEKNGKRKL